MGVGTWTPDRVAVLKALWADGVAGGVIAKRLGMTRGMVAGKRHSLGLPPREGAVAKAAQAQNGRRTALICGHVHKTDMVAEAAKAAAVAAMEGALSPLAGSNPQPWELRRAGQCAFPVDGLGATTLSCCEPIESGSAYCHGHREIVAGRPWPPEDPSPELAATQYAAA